MRIIQRKMSLGTQVLTVFGRIVFFKCESKLNAETSELVNTNNDPTNEAMRNTQTPHLTRKMMWSHKFSQNWSLTPNIQIRYGKLPGNQTRNKPVTSFKNSWHNQIKTQRRKKPTTASSDADDNIRPLTLKILHLANGQLEKPISTATLKFGIGDDTFAEHFVVLKKLTGLFLGFHFRRQNSVIPDTTHGLIHLFHLTMQVRKNNNGTSVGPQSILSDDKLTFLPMKTKRITPFVDHPSQCKATSTVTRKENFTEGASLIFSHAMSTITDKTVAVNVTSAIETLYTIMKNTQTAHFSVVTAEQSKFIRTAEKAVLSMIPSGGPDLSTQLNELPRTKRPKQQENTCWFPTSQNLSETEDQKSIQGTNSQRVVEISGEEKADPPQTMLNQEKISSNDLTGRAHCLLKLRHMQLKTFWLITMTFSSDIDWLLGWTRSWTRS